MKREWKRSRNLYESSVANFEWRTSLRNLLCSLAENTKFWTEFMCFRIDSTDNLL